MLVPLMNATFMRGRYSLPPFPLVKSGGGDLPLAIRMPSASQAPADRAAVPQHVAIIMDGNGRWAKQRGLPADRGPPPGRRGRQDGDVRRARPGRQDADPLRLLRGELEPPEGRGRRADGAPRALPEEGAGDLRARPRAPEDDRPHRRAAGGRAEAPRRDRRGDEGLHRLHARPRPQLRLAHRGRRRRPRLRRRRRRRTREARTTLLGDLRAVPVHGAACPTPTW